MKKNLNKILYKSRIKFKFISYQILGTLTLFLILFIAYLNERLIETSITIILFFLYRTLYTKQYHANSLIMCSLISVISFIIITIIEPRLNESLLSCIIIAFVVTFISYYLRDYLDNREHIKTIDTIKHKPLDNLTLEEMYTLMPSIKKDVIDIVYGYLHKERYITAYTYANSHNISEPLIYKYVKKVKDTYKSL